ncbi:Fic family protein [Burkholderia diffusa]|uniref:Fic family protein n=1 Tax=Burkholderia cepacia complex TaxID=87882 RepID=UPI0015942E4F|nr:MULTISPECIES: Fic family protein [Burkholderia cepacia complex]MDN7906215.1 Fic family protein [Burkholderia diffusa]
MILWELAQSEKNEHYTQLEVANTARQFSFLLSLIEVAKGAQQQWLSERIIKALNYHAIACLHDYAGEYRPCIVELGKNEGDHRPPMPHSVPAQMEHFVHYVNSRWTKFDAPKLAAFVLWRLNHIHPFVNGNGRTARAAAYFVACLRIGGALPGKKTLPELLCDNRSEYVAALKVADRSQANGVKLDLDPLTDLISRLLDEQVASAAD